MEVDGTRRRGYYNIVVTRKNTPVAIVVMEFRSCWLSAFSEVLMFRSVTSFTESDTDRQTYNCIVDHIPYHMEYGVPVLRTTVNSGI